MTKLILFIALIGFVAGAPVESEVEHKDVVPILRSERNHEADGSWGFLYEGGDGSFREEKGLISDAHGAEDDKKVSISGSYKYIDADGKEVEVHYTADENGFVPIGTNIPESISNAAKAIHDHPEPHSKH
ncbi:lea-1 family protein [Megaselia abdita]